MKVAKWDGEFWREVGVYDDTAAALASASYHNFRIASEFSYDGLARWAPMQWTKNELDKEREQWI